MGGDGMNNFLFALLMIIIVSAFGLAQEPSAMQVDEMVFCTAIEERQPVGQDTVFNSDVERVYCYTKLSGADDTTTVSHIWYFKDDEVARVNLSVNANIWRTWSSKKLMQIWVGKWRVDIIAADGTVLKSAAFHIKP